MAFLAKAGKKGLHVFDTLAVKDGHSVRVVRYHQGDGVYDDHMVGLFKGESLVKSMKLETWQFIMGNLELLQDGIAEFAETDSIRKEEAAQAAKAKAEKEALIKAQIAALQAQLK